MKRFKKILIKKFWYNEISQKWSHIKLKSYNWEVMIIPNHKEIKEWLLNWIISQISIKNNLEKNYVISKILEK